MKKDILPYIFIVIIAFIILHGIFEEGYLVRADNTIHLQSAISLKENLFQNQQITGWNYFDNLGAPSLTHTYMFSFLLIALLSSILKISLAYKLLMFLAFTTVPLLLYFILSKKFNKSAAFLISLTFFFHRTTIQQVLEGIWNQYLGMAFLLILFYYLDKHSRHLKLKQVIMSSILLSLTILTHLYVGLAAVYLFGLFFLFSIKRKIFSLLIPILSFLTTLFYLTPAIKTSNWAINVPAWGLSSTFLGTIINMIGILFSLQNLTTSTIISHIPIFFLDILAIIGIIIYFKKRNTFLTINFWFLIISIVIGTGFWFNFPIFGNTPLQSILSSRFLIIAKIPLFVFAAFTLSKIKLNKFTTLIPIVFLIILSLTSFQPEAELLKTSENSPELNDYYSTLEYLKTLDIENTRIVFQAPYRTTDIGNYAPLSLASRQIETPIIGAWSNPVFPITSQLDSASNKLLGEEIETLKQEELIEKMELYNAKYLVSITPQLTEKLTKFKKIKSFNNFTIFSLEDYNPEWVSTEAEYKIVQWQPYPIIEITNNNSKAILIKLAYHPFWEAKINNKKVEITNENNLMKINLEQGQQTLILKYT